MAWEKRGSSRYYYRKRRQGERVASEYLGNDQTSQVIYEIDRLLQEESLRAQAEWKRQKKEIQKMDKDIEFLTTMVRSLLRAKLLTSGYRPHKGQWRKKHHA